LPLAAAAAAAVMQTELLNKLLPAVLMVTEMPQAGCLKQLYTVTELPLYKYLFCGASLAYGLFWLYRLYADYQREYR
jgi:hypothetical protein